MVFIVPSWAGVMTTNVVKIVALLWISDAISSSASKLEKSVSILLNAEPCIDIPKPSDPVSAFVFPQGGSVPVAASDTHLRNPLYVGAASISTAPTSAAAPAIVRLQKAKVRIKLTAATLIQIIIGSIMLSLM